MPDLYIYLSMIGLVSVWSIYGLLMITKNSAKGISIYTYGLGILVVIQFFVGFVHVILLFNSYHSILMNNCLQRQPYRFFWWSANYTENEQFKQIYDQCFQRWSEFSNERLISWVVYSFASVVALALVIFHKIRTWDEYNAARGYVESNQEEEWSSDKKPAKASSTTAPPPYGGETVEENMHQQRQRLYNEIDKRNRARNNLNRRSTLSSSSSTHNERPLSVIHPLDFHKESEVELSSPHHPEPTWQRPGEEEGGPAVRQKRFDSHTSERMEYELYKSGEPATRRRHSSVGEKQHRSHRKNSQKTRSVRWSNAYGDAHTPLVANMNDLKEEENAENQETTELMEPKEDK
ncbi:hypothetical protein BY458DRAFT_469534 [Sporodiniella umbellata]|nr:hypothetical protein BY458DRAFT_469534 [Sporodiniella umbellata]